MPTSATSGLMPAGRVGSLIGRQTNHAVPRPASPLPQRRMEQAAPSCVESRHDHPTDAPENPQARRQLPPPEPTTSSTGCSSRSGPRSIPRWNTRSRRRTRSTCRSLVVLRPDATGFPEANARHYAFMLQGLREVRGGPARARHRLRHPQRRARPRSRSRWRGERRAARLRPRLSAPSSGTGARSSPSGVGCRGRRRSRATSSCRSRPPRASTNTPPARCGRRSSGCWDDFLQPLDAAAPQGSRSAAAPAIDGDLDLSTPEALLASSSSTARSAPVQPLSRAARREARRRLEAFLARPLRTATTASRNEPERGAVSHLSPYLHFGQISPVEIALAVRAAKAAATPRTARVLPGGADRPARARR